MEAPISAAAMPRHRGLLSALLAVALATASLPLGAADGPVHPDPGLDLTPAYESYWSEGRLDRGHIERDFDATARQLRDLRVLVAPSWLSDTARAAAEAGVFDFLGAQIEALREAGITVEMAKTDSEGSVADNAVVILEQIEASAQPLCLISHSKGGLDLMEALLRASAPVLEKVRCWVALQSPFAGSPLADLAEDNWLLRETASRLLPALGGSAQSLTDLTVAERRRYLARHAARIDAVLRRIAILCYAGRVAQEDGESFPSNLGASILSWAAEREMPSDGLVPVKSAILPHTHYIIAEGVDHAITVSDRNPLAGDLDRVLLIKLLLNLVFALPEDPPLKT